MHGTKKNLLKNTIEQVKYLYYILLLYILLYIIYIYNSILEKKIYMQNLFA